MGNGPEIVTARRSNPLVESTDNGLFCRAGNFHIDPWGAVDNALITHAHSDHARFGAKKYLCSRQSAPLLRERLGPEAEIESIEYGKELTIGDAKVSFYPAGHLLGSAQIRIEHKGQVCVVSGDYKLEPDCVCIPFEPLRCHMFLTESTFGLPVYRWRPQAEIYQEINNWWKLSQAAGRTCVLFAYALGKAQRVLSGLDASIGPILLHGAVARFIPVHEHFGLTFPEHAYADDDLARSTRGSAMVIAPPSAVGTPWIRKFGEISTGFASGWMRVRGNRRRKAVDRGFVLSDHADWNGLHAAIHATGAETIGVTHGYTYAMAHYLKEQGYETIVYQTRYEGELDSEGEP